MQPKGLLSAAMAQMPRECRYGHGLLDRIEGGWTLEASPIDPPGPQALPMELRKQFKYGVHMHRCRVCGYIEFSDA